MDRAAPSYRSGAPRAPAAEPEASRARRGGTHPGLVDRRPGAEAQTTLIQAIRGAAGAGVAQAKIGMELEVKNFQTHQPAHFYTKKASAKANPADRAPLRKGDVIVSGAGFEMQADELPGGDSDVEFVTDAFDEITGGPAMDAALAGAAQIATHINGMPGAWKDASALANFGTVRKSRAFIFQFGPAVAKPQTTVGLRMDQLLNVLTELGAAQGGEAAVDTASRLQGRQTLMALPAAGLFGGPPVAGPAILRMGAATTDAAVGVTAYKATNAYLNVNWSPSAQIKGLLALLTTYLDAARLPLPNYAKAIAPLMARTDFAQLYKMLPLGEQTYFSHNNGAEWMAMMPHIPMLAGLNMANPVFASGIHHAAPTVPVQLNALTCDLWLRGITQGTDLMTRRDFPTAAHRDEFESLGSMGRKTEAVGLGGVQGAIFELRGMAGAVPPGQWVTLGQRIRRWIRLKNQLDPRAFGQ